MLENKVLSLVSGTKTLAAVFDNLKLRQQAHQARGFEHTIIHAVLYAELHKLFSYESAFTSNLTESTVLIQLSDPIFKGCHDN